MQNRLSSGELLKIYLIFVRESITNNLDVMSQTQHKQRFIENTAEKLREAADGYGKLRNFCSSATSRNFLKSRSS